jgi:hypothetical protein
MTKPTHDSVWLHRRGLSKIGLIAGILTLASGCLASDPDEPPVRLGAEPAPCQVAIEHYLVTEIDLPTSAIEADRLGLDLDGDEQGRPDNAGGNLLAAFLAQYQTAPADLDAAIAAKLADGRLRWALRVETCAGSDDPWARIGLHRALDGDDDGVLEIVEHAGPPAGGWRQGPMLRVATGSGPAPLSALVDLLDADDVVEWTTGDGLAIEATTGDDGALEGKVGFGMPEAQTRAIVLPRLAAFFTYKLGLGESEFAATMDRNDDGTVTVEELEASGLFDLFLHADVDLFDESVDPPVFWPRHDEVDDRMSLGVGFRAVPVATE